MAALVPTFPNSEVDGLLLGQENRISTLDTSPSENPWRQTLLQKDKNKLAFIY
jgi:hypothetical protein